MKVYHTPEFRKLPIEERIAMLPTAELITATLSYELIGLSPIHDLTVNELRQHHSHLARRIQDEIDKRMLKLRDYARNVGTGSVGILENALPSRAFTRDPVRNLASVYDKVEFLLSPELFSDEYLNTTWPAEAYPAVQKPMWLARAAMNGNLTSDFPIYASPEDTAIFGRHNAQLDMEAFVYRSPAQLNDAGGVGSESELSSLTPSMLVIRSKKDIFGKAARALAEEYLLAKGDVRDEQVKMDIFDKAVPRDLVAITFCYTTDPSIGLDVINENYRQLASAQIFPDTRIRKRDPSPAIPFPHKRMYLTRPAIGVDHRFNTFVHTNYNHAPAWQILNEEPRDSIEVMALLHRDAVIAELDPKFDHDNYAELRKKGFRHPDSGKWVNFDPRHRRLIEMVSESGFSLRH